MKAKGVDYGTGWEPIKYEVSWCHWLWLKLSRRRITTKITVTANPRSYTIGFPEGVDGSMFTAGQRIKIVRNQDKGDK